MSAKSREPPNRDMTSSLALYDQFIDSLEATIDELASGQLADRYHQALQHALSQMSQERAAMGALFAAALAEDAEFDLFRGDRPERLARVYHRLVLGSDDALREPKALELGIALYTVHMLIVLFWLYDRSPDRASTQKLLKLVHELFKLVRPLFFLPMVSQGIASLAEIVLPQLRRESERAASQEDPRNGEHQDFDIHYD